MAITVYKKSAITGGLTAIDGDVLLNGDMAFVELSGIAYIYVLDDSAGSGPGSQVYPSKMIPTANYGTKAWLLQGISVLSLRINNVLVTATAAELNLLHGQVGILTGATGTRAIFYQDTAPSGWTILNTLDDKLLYITKGSAAGGQTGGGIHSSGSWSGNTGSHTLTEAEIPSHKHYVASSEHASTGDYLSATTYVPFYSQQGGDTEYIFRTATTPATLGLSSLTGGGGSHTHTLDSAWRPAAYCAIICSKN